MGQWAAIESLRWLGVAALAGMLLSAFLLQLTEKFDSTRSVSQAWSRSRRSYIFMGVSMTACGAAFCASLLGWLVPFYNLSAVMYPLVLLAFCRCWSLLGCRSWRGLASIPGSILTLSGA